MRHTDDRVPVELHIVSDSTGETAQRLVLALEAQFPDQPFEEVRHPRVENVDDLLIAVQQARGRPAVMGTPAAPSGRRKRRFRRRFTVFAGLFAVGTVTALAAEVQLGLVHAPGFLAF